MTSIETVKLWAKIEKLGKEAKQKMAAVAYVSYDTVLKFGKGDVLVCDASDKQVACGATSARVLADALARGAKLYSLTDLHAKLFVFDDHVVISSTNVSNSSLILHEAGVISNAATLCKQAATEINRLKASSERIDQAFVNRILKIEVDKKGVVKSRRKKPSLIEAFDEKDGRLDEYTFMMCEGKSSITDEKIARAAKAANVALPDEDRRWWVEDDDNSSTEAYSRITGSILALDIRSDADRITQVISFHNFRLTYICPLQVSGSTVHIFVKQPSLPFDLKMAFDTFAARFEAGLKQRSRLAKLLYKRDGWVCSVSDLEKILSR